MFLALSGVLCGLYGTFVSLSKEKGSEGIYFRIKLTAEMKKKF